MITSIDVIKAQIIKIKFKKHTVDKFQVMIIGNSMKPTMKRGDIVNLCPPVRALMVGDIIMFVHWKHSVTVHRIICTWTNDKGEKCYKTKGDNNEEEDPYIVKESDIIGIIDLS